MTNQEISSFSLRITQAGKVGLAAITAEIARVYIRDALAAQGQEDAYTASVKKAEHCVEALISGLDLNYKISGELLIVYQYMKNQLRILRSKRDDEVLSAIGRMLATLQGSFEEVAKQDTSGPLMANTQKVYAGLTYGQGTLNESFDDEQNRGFLA